LPYNIGMDMFYVRFRDEKGKRVLFGYGAEVYSPEQVENEQAFWVRQGWTVVETWMEVA